MASQNPSPVPGAFSMASPPTLYPPSFSQQQSRPPAAQHYQSRPLQQPAHAQPPSHAQHGFQHLHHQRHASQPHVPPYEDRTALSAFTPTERSLSERGSEGTHPSRILPPPAPAAVTLTAEQHRAQMRSTPSPLASSSLAPCMSSLSMESPRSALRTMPPSERASPPNRGVQLAEILNPVAAAAAGSANDSSDKSTAASASEAKAVDSQAGPLPSLGTVLASVRSDSPSADVPRDTCAPAAPAALGTSEAAPTATAGDKWRPW
ncbi:hypothetical protein GGF43_006721 [Coemansia sp. RSA 2618]|nr:hypothetical protein GGF43_006721 [Coemansia sp. RSA 2618]